VIKVYGLKNCDTCRKALKWLAANDIAHEFSDFRASPVEAGQIAQWEVAVGWETLLNRRGTTWRGLPDGDKDTIDRSSAIKLMTAHPALMKRPVFELPDRVLVGFSPETQNALSG